MLQLNLPAFVLAVTVVGSGPFFAAPPGWNFQQPSQEMVEQGLVAIWQPSESDGENFSLSIYPRNGRESLAQVKSNLIREEEGDGRKLISGRNRATCYGKFAGADIDMRFGGLVSQYYHMAVEGDRVYVLLYTHSIGDRTIGPSIARAIDSFCPSGGRAR